MELEIIEEHPVTFVELKEKLETLKKSQELSFRAKRTVEYLGKFAKESLKEQKEKKEKLQALELARLKEKHIVKILDVAPEDADSLKAVLSSESITIKQEDMQKVLECVK